MQGSARQLFQRLQGPMEEDTVKSHFEKIIMIGKKQHHCKSQVCLFFFPSLISLMCWHEHTAVSYKFVHM